MRTTQQSPIAARLISVHWWREAGSSWFHQLTFPSSPLICSSLEADIQFIGLFKLSLAAVPVNPAGSCCLPPTCHPHPTTTSLVQLTTHRNLEDLVYPFTLEPVLKRSRINLAAVRFSKIKQVHPATRFLLSILRIRKLALIAFFLGCDLFQQLTLDPAFLSLLPAWKVFLDSSYIYLPGPPSSCLHGVVTRNRITGRRR